MYEFWTNIWSVTKLHNQNSYWLKEIRKTYSDVSEMAEVNILSNGITNVINKLTIGKHQNKTTFIISGGNIKYQLIMRLLEFLMSF